MNLFNSIFELVTKLFQWYVIIMPWEQGVFVRAGSKVRVLKPGIYFKIPFIDAVYSQTTRTRVIDTPIQTVCTKDGKAITIKSAIGYSINDVFKLYNTISQPEMTLANMVMSRVGEYVSHHTIDQLSPSKIEDHVTAIIKNTDYGLSNISVNIMSYAAVRTFRLIQDSSYLGEGLDMNTKKP